MGSRQQGGELKRRRPRRYGRGKAPADAGGRPRILNGCRALNIEGEEHHRSVWTTFVNRHRSRQPRPVSSTETGAAAVHGQMLPAQPEPARTTPFFAEQVSPPHSKLGGPGVFVRLPPGITFSPDAAASGAARPRADLESQTRTRPNRLRGMGSSEARGQGVRAPRGRREAGHRPASCASRAEATDQSASSS